MYNFNPNKHTHTHTRIYPHSYPEYKRILLLVTHREKKDKINMERSLEEAIFVFVELEAEILYICKLK